MRPEGRALNHHHEDAPLGERRQLSTKERQLLTDAVGTVILAITHDVLPDVGRNSDLLTPNGVKRFLDGTYIQEDATNPSPWVIGLVANHMVVALCERRHTINWPDRFVPSLADLAGLVFLSSLRGWRFAIHKLKTGNPEAPIWGENVVIWNGGVYAFPP